MQLPCNCRVDGSIDTVARRTFAPFFARGFDALCLGRGILSATRVLAYPAIVLR
jgi:hypothetical protein